MEQITYTKPLIKWVGGKTQIIQKIIDEFPIEIDSYHELFVGGGSVLIALLENIKLNKIIIHNQIYAYDLNQTLISMYKNIQTKPNELYIEIQKIIIEFNSINSTEINRKPQTHIQAQTSPESYYYWIRYQFNQLNQVQKNTPFGSAYFIFLNKTCFRGIYREGPNGFNVPYGHYLKPEIINQHHLNYISELIKDVIFINSDFVQSFNNINLNDFIYMDPPYAPINSTSFVGYTSDGFNLEKHLQLFNLSKNYKFLMSNADVELVKNTYNDDRFQIKTIICRRTINSKNPQSKVNELLIKSY
jgi:DNA adenine methylase